MADIIELSEEIDTSPEASIVDSLQIVSSLIVHQSSIHETARVNTPKPKFAHQGGNESVYFQNHPKEKTELGRVSLELGNALKEIPDVSFTANSLGLEETQQKFEQILKTRSKEIAKIVDPNSRRREAVNLVASVDAFFAYLDMFHRGEGKEDKQVKIFDALNDPRYKDILFAYSSAAMQALSMFNGTTKGTRQYEIATENAGIPARKWAHWYLEKNKMKIPLELIGDEQKIKGQIRMYIKHPNQMDDNSKDILSLLLRSAHVAWAVDQIEREWSGENRLDRQIYRTFDGIKYLKREDELTEELYKDWKHITT